MSNDTCDKDACISAVGAFFFQTEGNYEHTSKVGTLENGLLLICLTFLYFWKQMYSAGGSVGGYFQEIGS